MRSQHAWNPDQSVASPRVLEPGFSGLSCITTQVVEVEQRITAGAHDTAHQSSMRIRALVSSTRTGPHVLMSYVRHPLPCVRKCFQNLVYLTQSPSPSCRWFHGPWVSGCMHQHAQPALACVLASSVKQDLSEVRIYMVPGKETGPPSAVAFGSLHGPFRRPPRRVSCPGSIESYQR